MKRFLQLTCILLALALPAAGRAATVTGNVIDTGAVATSTNITFTPLSTPQSDSPSIIFSSVKTATSDGSGDFSIVLKQGNYKVTVGANPKDSFVIAVPNDNTTNNWTTLVTSTLTYSYDVAPAYVLKNTLTSLGDLYTYDGTNVIRLAAGTQGQSLQVNTNATGGLSWTNAAGSGTVTSVGLSAPGIYSVSGSPVTGSGTLALSLATQTANTIWAGPGTGAAAAPAFRALVAGDLPTITSLGTVSAGTWNADVIGISYGGTGASTAAGARTALGLAIGTDVQAYDAELAGLAGLSGTGLLAQTGAGAFAQRTLTAGSSKVSVSNGDGVSGNPTVDVTEANLTLGNLGGTLAVAKGGTGSTTASDARTALGLAIGTDVQAYDNDLGDIAALTPTKGNLLVGNGTDWVAVSVGSNDQVLTADSAQSAGVKWAAAGASAGVVLKVFETNYVTHTTISGQVIPIDDTKPQNTEGGQVTTWAFTPTSSSSRVSCTVFGNWYVTASTVEAIATLFKDSDADALDVAWGRPHPSVANHDFELHYDFAPGSTSTITWKLRAGTGNAAHDVYLNGNNSGRLFGGSMSIQMIVTEYTP